MSKFYGMTIQDGEKSNVQQILEDLKMNDFSSLDEYRTATGRRDTTKENCEAVVKEREDKLAEANKNSGMDLDETLSFMLDSDAMPEIKMVSKDKLEKYTREEIDELANSLKPKKFKLDETAEDDKAKQDSEEKSSMVENKEKKNTVQRKGPPNIFGGVEDHDPPRFKSPYTGNALSGPPGTLVSSRNNGQAASKVDDNIVNAKKIAPTKSFDQMQEEKRRMANQEQGEQQARRGQEQQRQTARTEAPQTERVNRHVATSGSTKKDTRTIRQKMRDLFTPTGNEAISREAAVMATEEALRFGATPIYAWGEEEETEQERRQRNAEKSMGIVGKFKSRVKRLMNKRKTKITMKVTALIAMNMMLQIVTKTAEFENIKQMLVLLGISGSMFYLSQDLNAEGVNLRGIRTYI